jgi:folate-dependent phosphoribosylglycinamide formyltransferase PurN
MKITVFTSNQPRHINLINSLSEIADTVYAIQEVNTIFPGQVEDFFKKTPIMQGYFSNVITSEVNVFGNVKFTNNNVKSLSIKSGDLNKISLPVLSDALKSDYYVVFGSSYIKGELIEFLIDNKAYNIHMGISPYYRGNSCNFWALFDGNPEFVGATIHMLGKGLDSGDMLYHALPKTGEYKAFDLGMEAVRVAHESLVYMIKSKKIHEYQPIRQDKSLQIRYTRNADFTDEAAHGYLQTLPTPQIIKYKLQNRNIGKFLNPYIPK